MELSAKPLPLQTTKTGCAVVAVFADKTFSEDFKRLDSTSQEAITRLINAGDFVFKSGQLAWISTPPKAAYQRVLLVCLGASASTLSLKDYTSSVQSVARALSSRPVGNAVLYLNGIEGAEGVSARDMGFWAAEAFSKQAYHYSTTKKPKEGVHALKSLQLSLPKTPAKAAQQGLSQGEAVGHGINLARQLGNLPGNICTPTFLASEAERLSKTDKNFSIKVLDEKAMSKLGMGSLLAVARGSAEPPQLIVLEYKGKASKQPHVLVGKGVTFDTGGISLKPGAGMDEMKFDMCGAASVLGTLAALSQMQAAVHVVGIIATVENMPGSRATKPGDVVTSMSGQTIEILNTDAEGRLILCDALTYAERLNPKTVVDIATLTGACVVALGHHASGVFSNNQPLADALLKAGEAAQDRAWQMPLWDEYQKGLDSNFADIANIGGREGGSITAACFLSRFTKAYTWAHLDIAGTAWHSGSNKGATGRPVGLLVNYLLNA
ncbi:MAG: hypothetical protein RL497_2471 [Pseudomonadota bacterium]|jgi:leucyl aminopeptidase